MSKTSNGIVRGIGNLTVGKNDKYVAGKYFDRTHIRPHGKYFEYIASSSSEDNAISYAKAVKGGLCNDVIVVSPKGEIVYSKTGYYLSH